MTQMHKLYGKQTISFEELHEHVDESKMTTKEALDMQAGGNSVASTKSGEVDVPTLRFKDVARPPQDRKQYDIHASFRQYQDRGILSTPSEIFPGEETSLESQVETTASLCWGDSLGSQQASDEDAGAPLVKTTSAVKDLIRTFDSSEVKPY